jgi:hypothetical protein
MLLTVFPEEYEMALLLFEKGINVDSNDKSIQSWIQQCNEKIKGKIEIYIQNLAQL